VQQDQSCEAALFAGRAPERQVALEAACIAAAAFATAAYAAVLFSQLGGRLPYNDVYLGGDPLRILANFQSPGSDFHRSPFHPLFGLVCVIYQQARSLLHLETATILLAGATVCGGLLGGLAYGATRIWGGGRLAGGLAVAVLGGTAGFTYWTALPESHPWGGVSCLTCVILARFAPKLTSLRIANSAVICALSLSMVFTNVLLWVFAAPGLFLQGDTRDARRRRLLAEGAGLYIISGLAGLGLVTLAFALQRRLLHFNPTLVDMFVFSHDRKYILRGGLSHPIGGLDAMGLTAPSTPLATVIAPLLSAAMLIAVGGLSRRLPWRLRLFGLFLLGASVFHTIYARDQSFLCSPNYVGVWAVLLAVGLSKLKKPILLAGVAALAIAVGTYNFIDYRRVLTDLGAARTFPMDAHPLPPNRYNPGRGAPNGDKA
jgi:hypothetical protein